MHKFVLDFFKRSIEEKKLNSPEYSVLEIGSQDVNGSLRQYFTNVKEYIGVDIDEGNGVDIVYNGKDLPSLFEIDKPEDKTTYKKFDVIICTEVLEHAENFWETLTDIQWLLKPAAYLLLSARGATKSGQAMFEHSYPHDYWRFMPQSWPVLAKLAGCQIVEAKEDSQHPGFVMVGRKLPYPSPSINPYQVPTVPIA